MPTFSTTFTPPAPPSALTAFADVPASAIRLDWTSTALGGDFRNYRVSRSLDAGVTFAVIAVITTEATSQYDDYTAPLDLPLTYRVTVSNLDFESAPAVASSELDVAQWWIVRPGDASLTFRLTYVDDHQKRRSKPQELYRALGRSRPIVVSGDQQGWEGTVRATVPHAYRAMVDRLVAAAALPDEYVLLKSPFGEVFAVQLGDIDVARGTAGSQTVTFPFTSVA